MKVSAQGTSYNENTADDVIAVLEKCMADKTRVSIIYGSTSGADIGQAWGYDESPSRDIGYVSRSNGSTKVPIIQYSKRSRGAVQIGDEHILEIKTTRGRQVLYRHPMYITPRRNRRPFTATTKDELDDEQ